LFRHVYQKEQGKSIQDTNDQRNMHLYNSSDHMLTSPSLKQAVPQGEREEGSQALDSGRQETYLFEIQTEKPWKLRVKAISCVYILYADAPLHERDKLAQDMSFELKKPDSESSVCLLTLTTSCV
jgi:hypothetical protein